MKKVIQRSLIHLVAFLLLTGSLFADPIRVYLNPGESFKVDPADIPEPLEGAPTLVIIEQLPAHGSMNEFSMGYGNALNCEPGFIYTHDASDMATFDTIIVKTQATESEPNQVYEIHILHPGPPIVEADDFETPADSGSCTATINYDHVVIHSVPAATSVTYSIPPGSQFPEGDTEVEVVAVNELGTTTKQFTVTVTRGPLLLIQPDITVNNDPGLAGARVRFTPTVIGCDEEKGFTCSPPSGSFFELGSNRAFCRLKSAFRPPATNFTVTVLDAEAPVIMTPANITVPAETGQDGAHVSFEIVTRDNGDGLMSSNSDRASGSFFPLGTTVVTCSATDVAGNSSSRTFTVTVQAPADPDNALMVTSLADNGPGSLRAAIASAESTPEEDTILFDPSLTAGGDASILLTTFDTGLDGDSNNNRNRGEVGPTAFILRTPIRIEGPSGGHGITIQRDDNAEAFRLFHVMDEASLTLKHLTLSGGLAKGGDGFGNGGGGAGLGGGIFNHGTLSLQSVLLVDNEARGGSGQNSSSAGGGGGLGSAGTASSGGLPNSSIPRGYGSGGIGTIQGGFGGGGGGGGSNNVGGTGGFGGGGGGSYSIAGSPGFGGGFGFTGTSITFPGGGLGAGGAIFNEGGQVTLMNSTLSGNRAVGGSAQIESAFGRGLGGGIFSHNGDAHITNSTIASNTVEGISPDGGGIFNFKDWSLTDGSKGEKYHAITVCYNSIIADSIGGTHDLTTVTRGSYPAIFNTLAGSMNLIETHSDLGSLSIVSSSDPQLGPLSDNGGATLTHAPGAFSPAIDAGGDAIQPTQVSDQRGKGFPRNSRFRMDIGAFERQEMSYVIWQRLAFTPSQLADPRISGPTADPDGDGKPNLHEYAFAMNPMVSDQIGDEWFKIDPSDMTVRYAADTSRNDITYTLETCTDLSDWEAVTMPDQEMIGIYQMMQTPLPDLDSFFARIAISQN